MFHTCRSYSPVIPAFMIHSDPLQADPMTWVGDRWSDGHVRMVLIHTLSTSYLRQARYKTMTGVVHLNMSTMTESGNNCILIFIQELTGFPSEDEMLQRLRVMCMEQIACDVVGSVVFTNLLPGEDVLPKNVKYTIRTRSSGEMATTYAMTPQPDSAGPRSFDEGGMRGLFIIIINLFYFLIIFKHGQHTRVVRIITWVFKVKGFLHDFDV